MCARTRTNIGEPSAAAVVAAIAAIVKLSQLHGRGGPSQGQQATTIVRVELRKVQSRSLVAASHRRRQVGRLVVRRAFVRAVWTGGFRFLLRFLLSHRRVASARNDARARVRRGILLPFCRLLRQRRRNRVRRGRNRIITDCRQHDRRLVPRRRRRSRPTGTIVLALFHRTWRLSRLGFRQKRSGNLARARAAVGCTLLPFRRSTGQRDHRVRRTCNPTNTGWRQDDRWRVPGRRRRHTGTATTILIVFLHRARRLSARMSRQRRRRSGTALPLLCLGRPVLLGWARCRPCQGCALALRRPRDVEFKHATRVRDERRVPSERATRVRRDKRGGARPPGPDISGVWHGHRGTKLVSLVLVLPFVGEQGWIAPQPGHVVPSGLGRHARCECAGSSPQLDRLAALQPHQHGLGAGRLPASQSRCFFGCCCVFLFQAAELLELGRLLQVCALVQLLPQRIGLAGQLLEFLFGCHSAAREPGNRVRSLGSVRSQLGRCCVGGQTALLRGHGNESARKRKPAHERRAG